MKVVLEKAANECANVLQPSTKPEFNLLHGTLKFNPNLHDVTDSFESGYIWSKKNEGIPELSPSKVPVERDEDPME
jgi:hypothetical protein